MLRVKRRAGEIAWGSGVERAVAVLLPSVVLRNVESEYGALDDSVHRGNLLQRRVHPTNPVGGLAIFLRMIF